MHALAAGLKNRYPARRDAEDRGLNMLTWLAELSHHFGPLNVFRYITFRAAGASATALAFVFFFGPSIIASLRLKQGKGQPIRSDGPQSHLAKKGTPTMGGLMILSGLVVSTVLWANPKSAYVWIVLFVTLGFGAIGFYDDYLKVTKQSHKGFSGRSRLAGEAAIAMLWRLFHDVRLRLRPGDLDRRFLLRLHRAVHRQRAGDQAGGALHPWLGGRSLLVLPALRRLRHRRRGQCGQSHRRPRRPRHRAGDDRGGDFRHHRLSRRQRHFRALSRHQLRCRARAS